MSKYIKLNAAIRILWELSLPQCDYESGVKQLENLPTIEVSDAISRATALEIYSGLYWMDERLLNFKDELDKVYEKLRNAPRVIPKPKEGEWIADDDGDKKCSNCGEYAPLSFDDYYMRGGKIRQEESLLLCPYCGAKMFAKLKKLTR